MITITDIKTSQRHAVKITAGRIIPALATTTAMVCGLVDIEFCKLVLGLESQGRDNFLNSNINLAAGSGNFTTFNPDPPIPMETGLKSPNPESFTSWDKITLACNSTNEYTVKALVDYIEKTFGVTVDRLFAFGNGKDLSLYNSVDLQKLEWDISIGEDGKPHVSEGVFSQWPQKLTSEIPDLDISVGFSMQRAPHCNPLDSTPEVRLAQASRRTHHKLL